MEPVLSPGPQTSGLFLRYRGASAHARYRSTPYARFERLQAGYRGHFDSARGPSIDHRTTYSSRLDCRAAYPTPARSTGAAGQGEVSAHSAAPRGGHARGEPRQPGRWSAARRERACAGLVLPAARAGDSLAATSFAEKGERGTTQFIIAISWRMTLICWRISSISSASGASSI